MLTSNILIVLVLPAFAQEYAKSFFHIKELIIEDFQTFDLPRNRIFHLAFSSKSGDISFSYSTKLFINFTSLISIVSFLVT